MTGKIFEIREFCVHDGPGVRTTVFLQGCPLRCRWCQNPEGQEADSPDCKTVTAAAVADELKRGEDFLWFSKGGVTFSGGEPLMQADFVCAIVDTLNADARANGRPPWNFALETSGCAPLASFQAVAMRMDLIYLDLKQPTAEGHQRWTGCAPDLIWRNLAWLKTTAIPFVIRIVEVPTVNDSPEVKAQFTALIGSAPNLRTVEYLPYNPLAGAKYKKLGRVYELFGGLEGLNGYSRQ